ncbi:neutral/alkaline non-lysosomal ceramidase N-terminal domain-containing protein [Acinetobacter sp. ANC 4648]|uniref:neutral/alkaline non-lysosomal ceramidase N-terminal domain-containing protein n=1 Tax=Acinetobacter sp. ANC 4648 TaxID=1977875 RepID=UPI000A33D93A|nr:neutral/alkaline non-lysosomal ceramidase N-terminal domain-containing protein [Acinetobacter sp. ANC 4648]OTG84681.1 ceramidase [Acinetobacter sp. ANC 4648]
MYKVGWDKQEIHIIPKGYAMFGYGMWTHRADKKRTALYARSISIQHYLSTPLIFCCLDFGCITHAMRSEAIKQLQQRLGSSFQEQQLVLMATHTHSGPGGCGYEALYNMPTPGFIPEHLDAVIQAIVESICNALQHAEDTEISITSIQFDDITPIAWNRSIKAYNRNPEVLPRTEQETHLALNRRMQLIGFYRQNQLQSFISFFGVHATCLGNTLNAYDGDNKGYAATLSEEFLKQKGLINPVAIFAQATAGDVSPHFHGHKQQKIRDQIQGEQEYQYAQQNGRYQSELALQALSQPLNRIEGEIDALCTYVDLSNIEIPAEFSKGIVDARTSQPCHGQAFFAGTPVDGHGAPKVFTHGMSILAQWVRKKRLANPDSPQYAKYQALYASQGVKNIVMEAGDKKILGQNVDVIPGIFDPLIGEMNKQIKAGAIQDSPLVPSVVPLQLIQLGPLVLVCCPGEITTIAGQRVMKTVQKIVALNPNIKDVWLSSYCNDYMGYITTFEEYQQQAYEGGHTLFGQWTLSAVQFKFQQLAQQLCIAKDLREYDQSTRPKPIPKQELAKRTNHGNVKTAASQGGGG